MTLSGSRVLLTNTRHWIAVLSSSPNFLAVSSKRSSLRWQSSLLRAIVEPNIASELSQGPVASENNLTVQARLHSESNATAFVVDGDRNVSYGELVEAVGKVANLLKSKYGIEKGDRVLARTSKSLDSVLLYLATLQVGGIYIPVNPAYTERETTHFVKDAGPKLFVTCSQYSDLVHAEKVEHIIDENIFAAEARKLAPDLEVTPVAKDDVAAVCYTSGLPKGAMLTHEGLSWNGREVAKLWGFRDGDRLLHSLPFYHVHGLFISLHCSLFSHSTVILREKFCPKDVVEFLPQSTVFMGVPTYYSRLLAHKDFTRRLARNIRLFVSGSAPLSTPVWQQFKQLTGQPILERYGMTEVVIASNPYDSDGRLPGTVGQALPGTQVRVSKDIIEVKSPSLFKGYWRNPEKTKEEFTLDGFFITGDVGTIDNEGYIRILGRGKDLVISGGLNVYPKEVEDQVDRLEEVVDCAVIGVPHADFGEAVVAVCVLKNATKNPDALEDRLVEKLRAELSSYKLPKRIIFVDELPRNSMGKVQKNVLRDTYRELFKF